MNKAQNYQRNMIYLIPILLSVCITMSIRYVGAQESSDQGMIQKVLSSASEAAAKKDLETLCRFMTSSTRTQWSAEAREQGDSYFPSVPYLEPPVKVISVKLDQKNRWAVAAITYGGGAGKSSADLRKEDGNWKIDGYSLKTLGEQMATMFFPSDGIKSKLQQAPTLSLKILTLHDLPAGSSLKNCSDLAGPDLEKGGVAEVVDLHLKRPETLSEDDLNYQLMFQQDLAEWRIWKAQVDNPQAKVLAVGDEALILTPTTAIIRKGRIVVEIRSVNVAGLTDLAKRVAEKL